MSKKENNFYSEKLRKSLISFGLSIKPLVDEAVQAIRKFEDLGYTMMENAYIEKFGKLPEATRETQREMVIEWFLMEREKGVL